MKFEGTRFGEDGEMFDGYYTVRCDTNGDPEEVTTFTVTEGESKGICFPVHDMMLEEVLYLEPYEDDPFWRKVFEG